MAAGTYNISIDKGSDFSFTATLKDSAGSALNLFHFLNECIIIYF